MFIFVFYVFWALHWYEFQKGLVNFLCCTIFILTIFRFGIHCIKIFLINIQLNKLYMKIKNIREELMKASEPKWVNSDYIQNGVNSLKLVDLSEHASISCYVIQFCCWWDRRAWLKLLYFPNIFCFFLYIINI